MNNYNPLYETIISVEHNNMKGTYGTFRLKHRIKQVYGLILNHKMIRRYKQHLNLTVVVRKPRPLYLHKSKEKSLLNKAPNHLNCNFNTEKPLEIFSSDVSYIKCTDGILYLSAVKDLFNNEIISYETSTRNDINLILNSYLNIEPTNNQKAMIHTDQGSVYFSYNYIKIVENLGYTRSMSQRGCCWQNSPIENWFSQLKEECLRPLGYMSRKETAKAIKKYVQWYNTERIQRKLGYLSPIDYKQQKELLFI